MIILHGRAVKLQDVGQLPSIVMERNRLFQVLVNLWIFAQATFCFTCPYRWTRTLPMFSGTWGTLIFHWTKRMAGRVHQPERMMNERPIWEKAVGLVGASFIPKCFNKSGFQTVFPQSHASHPKNLTCLFCWPKRHVRLFSGSILLVRHAHYHKPGLMTLKIYGVRRVFQIRFL